MAQIKVSALTALTATDGNEELLINDGGTSKKVTIDNVLHDNSIRAEHYVDGSIATAHIADNAITSAKLGVDVIVAEDIAANAITVSELQANAVTTVKILDDNVTAAKLANSINAEIAANTAKTGITSGQASAIVANTAKTGISSGQTSAITANTAKVTNATHTGDVTGATALTIGNDKVITAKILDSNVTYAKIQNVSATNRILGRDSASAGVVEEITPANLRTMINVEDGATADQTAAQIKTALENGIDSVHYVNASIDNEHLAANSVDSDNYVDASIDLAHMSSESVDEDNLYISNAGSNGQFLSKQSGNDGGMTWAAVDALPSQSGNAGKFLTTDATNASWAVLDTDANTTTKGLYEMANVISANYVIGNNNNAMSAGPITINSNISVTVPSGSTWVIA